MHSIFLDIATLVLKATYNQFQHLTLPRQGNTFLLAETLPYLKNLEWCNYIIFKHKEQTLLNSDNLLPKHS